MKYEIFLYLMEDECLRVTDDGVIEERLSRDSEWVQVRLTDNRSACIICLSKEHGSLKASAASIVYTWKTREPYSMLIKLGYKDGDYHNLRPDNVFVKSRRVLPEKPTLDSLPAPRAAFAYRHLQRPELDEIFRMQRRNPGIKLKDIAERFNVSTGTISRVLNRKAHRDYELR